MSNFLHNNKEKFAKILYEADFKSGFPSKMIEKDYYVSLILKKLEENFDFVVFKGGTSLSKCHGVIKRFSEDIDITIDRYLTVGPKKKLKYGLVDICDELGLRIINLQNIRSRRDYNRYQIAYDSIVQDPNKTIESIIILETSYVEVAFPTETKKVHNLLENIEDEEIKEAIDDFNLDPFEMKVQALNRTLIDKVFALCDYYLQDKVKRYSRHIYDIYKIYPLVTKDDNFKELIKEVRIERAKKEICPSAKPGMDIPKLLKEIIDKEFFKHDYEHITKQILQENISYNVAIKTLIEIANSELFIESAD